MFVFRKSWRALLSCYLRFEIRPSALLLTILAIKKMLYVQFRKRPSFMVRGPKKLTFTTHLFQKTYFRLYCYFRLLVIILI